jgi:hypothetical protein
LVGMRHVGPARVGGEAGRKPRGECNAMQLCRAGDEIKKPRGGGRIGGPPSNDLRGFCRHSREVVAVLGGRLRSSAGRMDYLPACCLG